MTEKKFSRDVNMVVASEQLKKLFDELVQAGFTESQALEYMAKLMASITVQRQERGKK